MISKYHSVPISEQNKRKIVRLSGIDSLPYRPFNLFKADTGWTEDMKTHVKIEMTLVQLQRINKEIPIKSS